MQVTSPTLPSARFLRTAHVERDFGSENVLADYVPTPHVVDTVARISSALQPGSKGRAWRVTGDYGSGKSSLALALAHAFWDDAHAVPDEVVSARDVGLDGNEAPRLLPVLLTGEREPLAAALSRSVSSARERAGLAAMAPEAVSDTSALEYLETTRSEVVEAGLADGVLVVIDELGKLLEYAALHPDRQDIQLLQNVAEAADRSAESPLLVVGLLHQGFAAYAGSLTRATQAEWEKVAGRYQEILFRHPLEEVAILASRALGERGDALDADTAGAARRGMAEAVRLGWYGPGASQAALESTAPSLYPLHPTALPVLMRAVRLFGQNERTLFSFLLAPELNGLPEFAVAAEPGDFYGLPELYDYVSSTFGHRIAARSTRSHWSAISTIVDTFSGSAEEFAVLRAVGLLNLLNTDRYLATPATLAAAFEGSMVEVPQVVESLSERGVLFERGYRGGYCLWPHSSVDLEGAFQSALDVVGSVESVGRHIAQTVSPPPIVARRHYIDTGTLRTVGVRYVTAEGDGLKRSADADIQLVAVLSDTDRERYKALAFARSIVDPDTVVVVPQPLSGLREALREVDAWRYVVKNTQGLASDAYAAEEASRQVKGAQAALARRLDDVLGFTTRGGVSGADWFYDGEPVPLAGSRSVLAYLSEVCTRVYHKAPWVTNELVNRTSPSSSAVAARSRLIERVLVNSREASLGFSDKEFPPEKAIYLSVLQVSGLHRESDGTTGFFPPDENDGARLGPVFERMREVLSDADLAKVGVPELFEALSGTPYGVREGLLHLLLAVFYRIYERDVALYEDGAFVHRPSPQHFQRLAKAPERFALQLCPVDGVRSDLFAQLLAVVEADAGPAEDLVVLDVVRPLAVFAAGLPEHALNTRSVSPTAQRVRSALLDAKEPGPLIFRDLPEACGVVSLETSSTAAAAFVETLRTALDDLRAATPELHDRVGRRIAEAFGHKEDRPLQGATRASIQDRATVVLSVFHDKDLRAFAGRLADSSLSLEKWSDSVAALVLTKPVDRWSDDDEAQFVTLLAALASRFRHAEAAAFALGSSGGDGAAMASAVHLGVTEAEGTETARVLSVDAEEAADLPRLEAEAEERFRTLSRPELLAAARALGRVAADVWGDVTQP